MYTGSLAAVSNREDWIAVSPLIDEDGTEVTLTDASFEMFICKQGYPSSAELSGYYDPSDPSAGKITLPTTTSFQWWYTAEDMADLCAGTYDVFLRVTIDDVVTQILSCTVSVVEGGPS
jgi:hypothetical protein